MFKRLRNKLILINLGVTSGVIVVVFASIYMLATNAANQRPPVENSGMTFYSNDVENIVQLYLDKEKQAAANDLLVMLIVSGVAIELIVIFVSYFLAEEAIKPVRDAYEAQKVFIANASHEIKTPLAAIAANLEAADINGNKWISNAEKETAKLAALNAELLTLARTDLVEKSDEEEVDLKKLLERLLQDFEPRLRGVKVVKKLTGCGKVKLPLADFTQVFNILMDNAVKYCDGRIVVEAAGRKVTVANDGAVIDEKDLPHIFERFYQTDKSAEGVGLGLSIADSITKRNGWKLTAQSDKKMTSFTLEF